MRRRFYVFLLLVLCLLFGLSCKVKRAVVNPSVAEAQGKAPLQKDVAKTPILAKESDVDFERLFKKVFEKKVSDLCYPDFLYTFYHNRGFKPMLLPQVLFNGQLDTLISYLQAINQHGLNPKMFGIASIKTMTANLPVKKSAPNAYRDTVELELLIASSLLKYSSILQFGLIDPTQIDTNYFNARNGPDSIFVDHVLRVKDLVLYLDSIQPKGIQYIALQNALKNEIPVAKKTKEEVQVILKVNLERLRWRQEPFEQKAVMVNIPDFSLNVVDKGVSVLFMKVCVGEQDKATPQLSSKIYSVQVNPVWNIPESIARNEITKYAAQDRYYLENNNIDVFKEGKRVNDPESINWSKVAVSDYSFKQRPGQQNSLGKIKFLFNNESSVYLHDTPVKSAFKKEKRAISHGCVRVEKPLELAFALFGKGKKYDQIKAAMQSGYPRAKYIGLPIAVPIFITYYTATADAKGKVVFSQDVYKLDELMYARLSQY